MVVDDQNLVRQEQEKVALILGPCQLRCHRVELERQIVAEGSVKADIAVFGRMEQVDNHPQHRKHGRGARAFFLGEDPVRSRDLDLDFPRVLAGDCKFRVPLEPPGQNGNQRLAAAIIGFDDQLAFAR
jgi:hypothetical protein